MVKLVCEWCNLKFDLKDSTECPSCGREIFKKEPNAEDLLKEVEEILKD